MPKGRYDRDEPPFQDGKHQNKGDGNYNIRLVFPGDHWRATFEALKEAAREKGVSIPYMVRAVLHHHFIEKGNTKSYSECPRCRGGGLIEVSCPRCEGEGKVDFDPLLDGDIVKVVRGKPKPAPKKTAPKKRAPKRKARR